MENNAQQTAQPAETPLAPADIRHTDLVCNLMKSGESLIGEATPNKMELAHMAAGIAGEYLELVTAIENHDDINIVEEAGDLEFYIEGAAQVLCIEQRQADSYVGIPQAHDGFTLRDYRKAVEEFHDQVKKHVFYNLQNMKRIIQSFYILVQHQKALLHHLGLSRGDTLLANKVKLLERYPTGTFRNEDSHHRADKGELPPDGEDYAVPPEGTTETTTLGND